MTALRRDPLFIAVFFRMLNILHTMKNTNCYAWKQHEKTYGAIGA